MNQTPSRARETDLWDVFFFSSPGSALNPHALELRHLSYVQRKICSHIKRRDAWKICLVNQKDRMMGKKRKTRISEAVI